MPEPPDEKSLLDLVEQAAGVSSFDWNTVTGQVIWSRGLYRLLGLDPATPASADAYFAHVHPDDRATMAANTQRTMEGESPDWHYRIIRSDGQLRWVRSRQRVTRGSRGQVIRVVGTLLDVTESHEAGALLLRSNALLAETQRAAGVGTYCFNLTTGELEWSDEQYRILGYDRSVKPTPALSDQIVHPEDRGRQIDWGRRCARGEVVPPLQVRIVRPSGEIRHIECRARRMESDDGVFLLGASVDVTLRVALEEQLRHSAKMDAIGTLAAGVAHDFNNYVTVIGMHLEMLRRQVDSGGQALVEAAQHAADQCALLTRQLLAFARRQPPARRRIELCALVRDVASMFGRLAGSAVELHTQLPGDPVHIHADPGQLESLLMNLTVNARDAMPEGGRLTVAVAAADLATGHPRLPETALPGRYAVLRVEDTGTGIAPEHLQRIFEPYFTTKAMGRGTGLGLASVYGVVREHEGFVHVDSEVGRGTTFEVYLPMGPERASRASAPPRAARAVTRRGVVLVVDDMEPLRAMVTDVLRDAGMVVLAAGDGLEALEALGGKDPIDVVVTDLLMPRMSGVELAQALRERAPRLGIVFMSGYADRDLLAQVEAVVPSAPVLHKPFTAIELEQVVSQELRRRQDSRTSAP